ncbi:MAG TPA: trehalase family glycosidase [Acidimicrobiales bacterium]|nr:trehalase family glycosidase [Acidimicrobiales bacterium]
MTGTREHEVVTSARPADLAWVESEELRDAAIAVLSKNARAGYVAPARGLYVHQHLWDSCFVAIGQRHIDPGAAMGGLERLVEAQWSNGMIPNISFERGWRYWLDRRVWRSRVSSSAPRRIATGGISQPPMLAEAVVRVGEVLPGDERLAWYRRMHRPLVAYHRWLHLDRGADGSGLVTQIHPWETGLDDSPPLLEVLGRSPTPWWIDLVTRTRADRLASRLRRDTKYVPADERSSTVEALRLYGALRRIRALRYDDATALRYGPFVIQDLTTNSVLVRANARLRQLAQEAGLPLPPDLVRAMRVHESAVDRLWDPRSGSYFSRDPRSGELVAEPSVAALMPLYAGCPDGARAEQLVDMLLDPRVFGAPYPVPSVPLRSRWFQPRRYWQGPTWINMNWLVIDGLRRYGFDAEADALRLKTLAVVARSGFSEYYHPLTGTPAGAKDFSWTAALVIDLLSEGPRRVDLQGVDPRGVDPRRDGRPRRSGPLARATAARPGGRPTEAR